MEFLIMGVTNIEQSKALLALGMKLESADMYYDRYGDPFLINNIVTHDSIRKDPYQHLIPAWSLSALLELIPSSALHNDQGLFYMQYFGKEVKNTRCYDSPIQAAYEMMVWLLEEEII